MVIKWCLMHIVSSSFFEDRKGFGEEEDDNDKNVDKLQIRLWTQQKQLKSKHFWQQQRQQQKWCQTDLGKVQEKQLGMCLQLQGTVLILLGMSLRLERPLIQLPLSLLELLGMQLKLETFTHKWLSNSTLSSGMWLL